MNTKTQLIECFRALCELHGVDAIASKTHSNVEGMKQIQRGLKLASGEPRGVGPELQKRLDKHYPGWTSLAQSQATAPPHLGGSVVITAINSSNLQ